MLGNGCLTPALGLSRMHQGFKTLGQEPAPDRKPNFCTFRLLDKHYFSIPTLLKFNTLPETSPSKALEEKR